MAEQRQGGSYVNDPETGQRTLVEQTEQRAVTRLEQPKKSTTKRSAKPTSMEK
ncbi:MAG: hypothetical protein HRU23_19020 [Gammaproteobacteria bacterium]|nr:hypothetical protein [Gammaproteobacteria bacterium]